MDRLHRPDPYVGCGRRRTQAPQGGGRFGHHLGQERGGEVGEDADTLADKISEVGGTPLLVAVAVEDGRGARVPGVIHLKDVVKDAIRERFDELRRMGIETEPRVPSNSTSCSRN